jgi:integrase
MAKWAAHGRYPGIFQDVNDPKHWRVVVNLGRADKGEPRRRAVRVLHGTLTDARETRTTLQSQRDRRQLRPQKTKAPKTVGEWMTYWLETYKRRRVTAATLDRYDNEIRLYILPNEISGRHLRRLTPDDVQEFYNALGASGLAPGTIFQVAARLRQALNRAVSSGVMGANPMTDTEAPKRPGRRKLRIPSDEELRALLEVMREGHASAYPITRMALASGMREGEIIALEWASVDLKNRTVWVCRSASRVPAGSEGRHYYEYEFKTTKTDDSTAAVPIDADTAAWLAEWKKTVLEAKMQLRPHRWTDTDGDLVFPCLSVFAGSPAGRAWQQGTLRKAFGRYSAQVDLGHLRFHDLRHIYGGVLHRNGVPLLTISRLMRHKSIKTTADIYGHIGDEERRDAVSTLSTVFSAMTKEPR